MDGWRKTKTDYATHVILMKYNFERKKKNKLKIRDLLNFSYFFTTRDINA